MYSPIPSLLLQCFPIPKKLPGGSYEAAIRDSLSSRWHSRSPDGKWLVTDKSTKEGKNFVIYLMNYKTNKTIRLTDGWKTGQAPVFVKGKYHTSQKPQTPGADIAII